MDVCEWLRRRFGLSGTHHPGRARRARSAGLTVCNRRETAFTAPQACIFSGIHYSNTRPCIRAVMAWTSGGGNRWAKGTTWVAVQRAYFMDPCRVDGQKKHMRARMSWAQPDSCAHNQSLPTPSSRCPHRPAVASQTQQQGKKGSMPPAADGTVSRCRARSLIHTEVGVGIKVVILAGFPLQYGRSSANSVCWGNVR